MLSVVLLPKASICCVVSSPLQAPGEQPQRTFSKVLSSTTGGQSNQGADKERATFPSWRDCWDLLEGVQLVNEHSRAESGLESVINCHKTSESKYIGGTHVCPRDGPRKRGSAQPNPHRNGEEQLAASKQDDVAPKKTCIPGATRGANATTSSHPKCLAAGAGTAECPWPWSWSSALVPAHRRCTRAVGTQPVKALLLMSSTVVMKRTGHISLAGCLPFPPSTNTVGLEVLE